jgi:heme A synthase
METSPILEVTHRLLAGSSGLLILLAAIAGLARTRRQRWIVIPPLAALALVVEVSFFGARAVLYGLTPGWAAVDVGSALLVVALMVTSAVVAHTAGSRASLPTQWTFRNSFARLVLVMTGAIYGILVSGVLVSGKDSITGCLGWPLYSLRQFQLDGLGAANILRLILSVAGMALIVAVVAQAWRRRGQQPAIFRAALWLGALFLLELLIQGLLLTFGFQLPLLVLYTVTAAALWGQLVVLLVITGLQDGRD